MSLDLPSILIAWTTTDSEASAQALAKSAVEAHVAACAQVHGPISSTYRWKGEVHSNQEWRITFNTPHAHADSLEYFVQQHHPYDTPQWVAVLSDSVSPTYRAWVEEEG